MSIVSSSIVSSSIISSSLTPSAFVDVAVAPARNTPSLSPLVFQAGSLLACRLNAHNSDEMQHAYALRYDYFVQQRGWVAPDPLFPCRERDRYDAHAHHLTVFDGGDQQRVAAYLRVIERSATCGFMLEHEFRPLLPDPDCQRLHSTGAVELSRLVLAVERDGRCSSASNAHQDQLVLELLLKLLYHTSLQQGWNCFYIVVEHAWPVLLKRRFGLPFQALGPPHVFPDGTKTVAATATLAGLEAAVAQRSTEKLRWYQD